MAVSLGVGCSLIVVDGTRANVGFARELLELDTETRMEGVPINLELVDEPGGRPRLGLVGLPTNVSCI